MKKLILLIATIITLAGCSKPEDAYPRIEGTRTEVDAYYFKTYSMHTNNWSEGVKAAYSRDMDFAKAE